MKKNLSNAQKRQFWKKHIDAYLKTSDTQKAYCHKHSISSHQLSYWKGVLTQDCATQANPPRETNDSKFAQVKVSSVTSDLGLSVVMPNGIQLVGVNEANSVFAVKLAGALL